MSTIRFTSYLDFLPKLKLHHITVPADITEQAGGIGTRLLCSVNGNEEFHCGLVAKGAGSAYISINKKRIAKWGLQQDEELQVILTEDTSKYGMEMPEELEALLEQDLNGARLFEALSAGKQRYIIHYVSGVKSSQKKIDRAIKLINNLKTMPETFDMRHLLGLPHRE